MRVISQDGTIDVPYDYFSLSIASGKYEDVEVTCIYCHNLSSPNGTKLAKYSSREKALKVMEMLRTEYLKYLKVDGGPMTTMNFYVQPNVWNIPKVFQFPKDDEVEV